MEEQEDDFVSDLSEQYRVELQKILQDLEVDKIAKVAERLYSSVEDKVKRDGGMVFIPMLIGHDVSYYLTFVLCVTYITFQFTIGYQWLVYFLANQEKLF